MIRRLLVALACTSMLSACYSFRGPEPVFERGTVHHRDAVGPRSGYLYEQFRTATLRASGCGREPYPAGGTGPGERQCDYAPFADAKAKQAALDEFMETGFTLIASDCSHYFAHMGRRQSGSRLTRNVIAPIGDLITGIIAIARIDDANTRTDVIAGLTLARTTTTSALDVYDRPLHF